MIFVYGTLLAGERNHAVLEGARFVREAQTAPIYRLVDLGDYPALLENGETKVEGELWDVPPALLPRVDLFEGVPELFVRKAVLLEDGSRAEAYFFAAEGDFPPIAGGNWKKR